MSSVPPSISLSVYQTFDQGATLKFVGDSSYTYQYQNWQWAACNFVNISTGVTQQYVLTSTEIANEEFSIQLVNGQVYLAEMMVSTGFPDNNFVSNQVQVTSSGIPDPVVLSNFTVLNGSGNVNINCVFGNTNGAFGKYLTVYVADVTASTYKNVQFTLPGPGVTGNIAAYNAEGVQITSSSTSGVTQGSYCTIPLTTSLISGLYSYGNTIYVTATVDNQSGISLQSNSVGGIVSLNPAAPVMTLATSGQVAQNASLSTPALGQIPVTVSLTANDTYPITSVVFQVAPSTSANIAGTYVSSNTVSFTGSNPYPTSGILTTTLTLADALSMASLSHSTTNTFYGYFVRCQAVNSNGSSVYSNVLTAVPAQQPNVSAVTLAVTANSSGDNTGSLSVNWTNSNGSIYQSPYFGQTCILNFYQVNLGISVPIGPSNIVVPWNSTYSGVSAYGYQLSEVNVPEPTSSPIAVFTVTLQPLITLPTNINNNWTSPALVNKLLLGPLSTASGSPSTVPAVPLSLQYFGGNGQNQITWQKPVTDGGSVISSYTVLYNNSNVISEGNDEGGLAVAGTVSVSSAVDDFNFIHTGLTNGLPFYYAVKAVNSQGSGPHSRSNGPVVPQSDAPQQPGLTINSASVNTTVGSSLTVTASSIVGSLGTITSASASVLFFYENPVTGEKTLVKTLPAQNQVDNYVYTYTVTADDIANGIVTFHSKFAGKDSAGNDIEGPSKSASYVIGKAPTINSVSISSTANSSTFTTVIDTTSAAQSLTNGITLYFPAVNDPSSTYNPVVVFGTSGALPIGVSRSNNGTVWTFVVTFSYPCLPEAQQPYLLVVCTEYGATNKNANL
jgi:hypothetical protein